MRFPRPLHNARTVAAMAARANGPARWRARPFDDVASAGPGTVAGLPPLDLSIAPWPPKITAVAGGELFVRHTPATAPDAGTAVYVHGLGGASTNWTDLAAQLAPWLEGYAPDLPGFGRSGPSATDDYSMRTQTRVVVAYLEQLAAAGTGPVHLFGNSMGGAIAITVAARRPDLVRTLTLISPAVPDLRLRRDDDPRTALLMVPGVGRLAMRRMAELDPEVRARGLIAMCFGDPTSVPAHRVAEAAAEVRHRQGMAWADDAFVRALKGLVVSWLSPRPWQDLAAISASTLVVWGDRDRLVSPELAPEVARRIPRSQLLVLPGVGHVAQLEAPVATARAWLAMSGATARSASPVAPDAVPS